MEGEFEQIEACELDELNSLLSPDQLTELKTRRYQQEIIEKVLRQNCIVFLGTGTGKTFIAAEAIKRLKSQILGPWTKQAADGDVRIRTHFRRTFFVCNMVPLAIQQEEYLANHLGVKFHVKRVIGADLKASSNKDQWFQEFEKFEVFVVTGEILRNLLSRAIIQVRDINLLIFDEAHHVSKDDIYKQIMDKYHIERRDHTDLDTRIIGLTASLLNEKNMFTNLGEKLQNLTSIYNSRIVTTRDFVEVDKHCARPDFSILSYSEETLDSKHSELCARLSEFIIFLQDPSGSSWKKSDEDGTYMKTIYKGYYFSPTNPQAFEIKNLNSIKKLAHKLKTVTEQLGPWACYKFAVDIFLKISNHDLCNNIELDYVQAALVNLSNIILLYFSRWNGMQPDKHDVSNKVQVLCSQLKLSSEQKGFCGIAFIKDKIIAYMLNRFMKELSAKEPDFAKVKSCHFTGQSPSALFPEIALSCNDQIERLKEFRSGKLNFLLATDVLLEGFNVPQCNLVITFDSIDHYRYFTQSRGRARAEGGHFISLVPIKNEERLTQELLKYDKAEIDLRKFILDNYFYFEDDIVESENMPKPLVTKLGATITYEHSVSYLYQYCQHLIDSDKTDQFTVWMPVLRIFKREQNKANQYYCVISMPKSCYALVENVDSGLWVNSIKVAQRCAALNVCKKLYELGEINDSLEPKLKQVKDKRVSKEGELDCDRRSHRKRKKTYPIKLADSILNLSITNTTDPDHAGKYLMYPILMVKKERTSHTLAILSSTPLGQIPTEFELIDPKDFNRFQIKITGPYNLSIANDTVEQLIRCHEVILKSLLSMPRNDFQFMSTGLGIKKYIIIPIEEGDDKFDIDYKRLDRVLKTDSGVHPKHLSTDLEPGDYIGKFVRKHYDPNFMNTHYKIVEAGKSVSIDSAFSNQEVATTYKDYFKNKYGIELNNSDQPYIKVEKFKFSLLNYTKKIHKTQCSQEETNQISKSSITLFPELVKELPLYSNISSDVLILPSVLHKLESYLIVVEFREKIYPNLDSHFINTDMLYSALTLRRCQEEYDLERLEFLGDTCLKILISLSLYCTSPAANQALLTVCKSIRVSNKTLFEVATEECINLPSYIRGREFLPKTNWLPPRVIPVLEMPDRAPNQPESQIVSKHLEVNGDTKMDSNNASPQLTDQTKEITIGTPTSYLRQSLAHKSIADSFEAIIGAIITSAGLPAVMHFLNKYGGNKLFLSVEETPLNLNVPLEHIIEPSQFSEDHFQMFLQHAEWFQNIFKYKQWPLQTWDSKQTKIYEMNHQNDIATLARDKLRLQKPLCEREEHRYLLLEALTHDSYNVEDISLTRSYQRMEFLGDALLDYLVTTYLMCHAPSTYQPRDLHTLRMCVVSNRNFARLAVESGLYQDLLYTSQRMERNIRRFVNYIQDFQEQKNTPKELKFYKKELSYLLQQKRRRKKKVKIKEVADIVVDAPKALGDVFESLACAVFLITDFSLEAVWNAFGYMLIDSIQHFLEAINSIC